MKEHSSGKGQTQQESWWQCQGMRLCEPVSPARGRPRQDGGDSKDVEILFLFKSERKKGRAGERESEGLHSVRVNFLVQTAGLKSHEMLRLGRAPPGYKQHSVYHVMSLLL